MLAHPVVASALTAAIGGLLMAEDTYTDHVALAALPHLLVTVLRIIKCQPVTHMRLLPILLSALDVAGAERPDASRSLLRLLLELLLQGHVVQVLDDVVAWSRSADPSLSRFFALQVSSAAGHCQCVLSWRCVSESACLQRTCLQPTAHCLHIHLIAVRRLQRVFLMGS